MPVAALDLLPDALQTGLAAADLTIDYGQLVLALLLQLPDVLLRVVVTIVGRLQEVRLHDLLGQGGQLRRQVLQALANAGELGLLVG